MTKYRLICVDDDPLALEQVKDVLCKTDLPLDCEFFGSPTRAIEAHQQQPAQIVISDLRMGATDGLALITTMRETAPDAVYMLLSAKADLESALLAVNEVRVFRFLTKPARLQDISAAVSGAINELAARDLRTAASSTLSAIEQKKTAVATVDINGKIIYANAPAYEIFSDAETFRIGDDRVVRSADSSTTRDFRQFLSDLADSKEERKGGNLFRFSRAEGESAVVVSAVYFDDSETATPHFSLIIADPSKKEITSAASIATALHLTPSEARVVHGLVLGGGVAEAATHAGVSLSTARSYLKNVFHKTGVSKQAELVRLALLSAA